MLYLSSAYLAPIQYYAKIVANKAFVEERCEHYVKQTYRNRCLIATADGVLPLTIPIEGRPKEEGGTSKTAMKDIRISSHGRWQELHWNALVSAYENSPFFEYYADEFEYFYRNAPTFLVDFNEALRSLVLRLLNYEIDVQLNLHQYISPNNLPYGSQDEREKIRPKIDYNQDPTFCIVPYHQVFAQRTGFLPNLSIVDLLFNMGNESRIVLQKSIL